MRFRGCFRQCNGKIPLKLNGRPHFCRRSTVLAFCGSPCRVCAGRKPGRSPIAPPERSWRPSAAVSRPPGGWGCAPPSPQTCQKEPATSPGRPLQTAGFSPQGSRPADGFGGRWPPTAPRSGAGPAGPLPAQTYPTGIPRSIGCNCRPSSAAASAALVRESSAARLVGFFRGSSCPKGTK